MCCACGAFGTMPDAVMWTVRPPSSVGVSVAIPLAILPFSGSSRTLIGPVCAWAGSAKAVAARVNRATLSPAAWPIRRPIRVCCVLGAVMGVLRSDSRVGLVRFAEVAHGHLLVRHGRRDQTGTPLKGLATPN